MKKNYNDENEKCIDLSGLADTFQNIKRLRKKMKNKKITMMRMKNVLTLVV